MKNTAALVPRAAVSSEKETMGKPWIVIGITPTLQREFESFRLRAEAESYCRRLQKLVGNAMSVYVIWRDSDG